MLPWLWCHCGSAQLLSFPGCEPTGQRRKHSPHVGCSSRCKTSPTPTSTPSLIPPPLLSAIRTTAPNLPCTRVSLARLQHPFTWGSVLWSCLSGHMTLVTLLLNYFAGLDLERRDQRGLTALMKAAIRDRSDCVAALLMAGVWLHALRYHPTRHHLIAAVEEGMEYESRPA